MRDRNARVAVLTLVTLALLATGLAPAASAGAAAGGGRCHAGAAGVGDDYYPLYGNGG